MERLRWDNIARAAAVLAVIALVVAWPRLRGAPPDLPPAAATPVALEPATETAPAPQAPATTTAEPPRPVERRLARPPRTRAGAHRGHPRHVAARRRTTAHPRRPQPRPVLPPTSVRVAHPASAPARRIAAPAPPAPSPSDQAAREFALP